MLVFELAALRHLQGLAPLPGTVTLIPVTKRDGTVHTRVQVCEGSRSAWLFGAHRANGTTTWLRRSVASANDLSNAVAMASSSSGNRCP